MDHLKSVKNSETNQKQEKGLLNDNGRGINQMNIQEWRKQMNY